MKFRPGRRLGRALLPLVLGTALASSAAAQTQDPIFARWRWTPESLGSRPAGMGGAFVSIADGVNAAHANPAGLTLVPIREVHLSSGPWLAAGGGPKWLRSAVYLARTGDQDGGLDGLGGAGAATGGFLDSSVWEAGLAFGAHPLARLRVGATVAWSRLHLEGQRTASAGSGQESIGATLSADSGHLRLTGGLLLDLVGVESGSLPSLRLGLSYQPGFDWSAQIAGGSAADGGATPVDIRRPSLVAIGLAWRGSDRWSFSAQGDLIRYSEIVDTLRRNVGDGAAGFRLPDAAEPRFGTEFAAPLWCGCGIVKLRAGIHYRSPGTLRYQGTDPEAAVAFTSGRWRTVATLGGSFFAEYFGNALRLDVDSQDLVDGPDLSFGIVWRF